MTEKKNNALWYIIGGVIVFVLIIIIFIANSNSNKNYGPVCNSPYTLLGNFCCLDSNSNNICDKEEIQGSLERCDTIENPRKVIELNSVEEAHCLDAIKEASGYAEWERCTLVYSEPLDPTKYYSLIQQGYKYLAKCQCCYNYTL